MIHIIEKCIKQGKTHMNIQTERLKAGFSCLSAVRTVSCIFIKEWLPCAVTLCSSYSFIALSI